MARTIRGQISEMIRDVEKAARQIRTEVRKQYDVTPKVLDQAASQLRRGAAEAAYQVERYIREVRMELQEGGGKKAARKNTTKKTARRKTAKKATRKSAKKTARKTAKKAVRKSSKKTTRKSSKKTTRKNTRQGTRRRAAR